jgi:hypothetical protein
MINFLFQFMKEHFDNLTLKPPLFYSWEYGICFEISMPWVEHEDKENLQQIKERINGIFNRVFDDKNEMLLITYIPVFPLPFSALALLTCFSKTLYF